MGAATGATAGACLLPARSMYEEGVRVRGGGGRGSVHGCGGGRSSRRIRTWGDGKACNVYGVVACDMREILLCDAVRVTRNNRKQSDRQARLSMSGGEITRRGQGLRKDVRVPVR